MHIQSQKHDAIQDHNRTHQSATHQSIHDHNRTHSSDKHHHNPRPQSHTPSCRHDAITDRNHTRQSDKHTPIKYPITHTMQTNARCPTTAATQPHNHTTQNTPEWTQRGRSALHKLIAWTGIVSTSVNNCVAGGAIGMCGTAIGDAADAVVGRLPAICGGGPAITWSVATAGGVTPMAHCPFAIFGGAPAIDASCSPI